MVPEIVVYYLPGEDRDKIAKCAFVNVGDALIYWKALADIRKKYLRMETLDGEPITEISHDGYNDSSWAQYYAHAYALTAKNPLPPHSRTREHHIKTGGHFEKIANSE